VNRRPPTHSSEGGPPPFEPHGKADLHVHSLASDGTASIEDILRWVEEETDLDVLGIADHERIDGALAARAIARARGYRFEVVVGEEVSTRGGHLLALFLEEPIRPLRSLRDSIAAAHEQGGLAIPAHPLFPYPMCAQAWMLRRLLAAGDPRVRPDALEAFNPTTFGRPVHRDVVRFAAEQGLPTVGNSDAHDLPAIAAGWTTFPGRTAEDLRAAILEGRTGWHGSFHGTISMVPTFGKQLRKYGRDLRDEIGGRLVLPRSGRQRTGRDLGYPGGRLRPARLDETAINGGCRDGERGEGEA